MIDLGIVYLKLDRAAIRDSPGMRSYVYVGRFRTSDTDWQWRRWIVSIAAGSVKREHTG